MLGAFARERPPIAIWRAAGASSPTPQYASADLDEMDATDDLDVAADVATRGGAPARCGGLRARGGRTGATADQVRPVFQPDFGTREP